ncbi:conserved hypothetical protein [Paraburkholderia ribeironis]|uniref:Uncharacterized protein n=1 Tax=Paraburkholderia ribeironis TaxID=1247936 RepID=A0A1N7SEB9_9BURK|nr:HAD domain-containing protein [Paraburkholderia ribeironis]SIT45672.1 conserved hypothetical protein [Paraburkholderia ribeironis]
MNDTQFRAPERTWASTRSVLFVDFDGVLHRGDAYRTSRGIVSSHPSIELFEYASVLAEALVPYPDVEIVLSTSWVKVLGFTRARDSLPLPELRHRVRGATFHTQFHDSYVWNEIPRGEQVRRYVTRHRLVKWLAIDDRDDGFETVLSNLVLCDVETALGDAGVQAILKAALHDTFRGGSRPRSRQE